MSFKTTIRISRKYVNGSFYTSLSTLGSRTYDSNSVARSGADCGARRPKGRDTICHWQGCRVIIIRSVTFQAKLAQRGDYT